MNCPVCQRTLVEYVTERFTVDICRDGCSGIWFDKDEFEKCDQAVEAFPTELLRVRKIADVVVNRSRPRSCPRCSGLELTRIVLDSESNFEIDYCKGCAGHWLDIGELEHIRKRDHDATALEGRLKKYEEQITSSLADTDRAHRFIGLVKLLFK